MAYDEGLAERLRDLFAERPGICERKMFDGLAFMYRGHMLVGILGDSLMARVGPAEYAAAIRHPHIREMDFTGKPMKGYIYVDPAGIESDTDLDKWIGLCLRFNESLPHK